jgi:hypothetical protein
MYFVCPLAIAAIGNERSWDSLDSKTTGYGPMSRESIPDRCMDVSLPYHCVQIGSDVHPAS